MLQPRHPYRFYAETSRLRTRQIVLDVAVVVWSAVWVRLGLSLFHAVDRLRSAGDSAEAAGAGLASRLSAIAKTIGGVPLAGGALERPFVDAADASRSLQQAGATASSAVHTVALWAGVLLALVPIIWLLARYAPGRIRWIREATAAAAIRIDADDLRLFAIRAIATHPLYDLRRACPDPSAALAAGDYAPLASR
ncbi:MAG TPA: hypothetical protein VHN98_00640, partial [Acidimicrobiales bacterium]|nr:hypothetical protein [Acidimicrobiales bacterium]